MDSAIRELSSLTMSSERATNNGTDTDVVEVALRPDRCSLGRAVKVDTNFISILSAPSKFYVSDAEFGTFQLKTPSGVPVTCQPGDFTEKARIVRAINSDAKLCFLRSCKMVYSDVPIHSEAESIVYYRDIKFQQRSGDFVTISFVKLTYTETLETSNCPADLVGTRDQPRANPELLAAMNACVQRLPATNPEIVRVGSHRFFFTNERLHEAKDLGPLIAKVGYVLTVRATEMGNGIIINPTTTCFMKAQPLSETNRQLKKKFNIKDQAQLDWLLSSYLSGLLVKIKGSDDSTHSLKRIHEIKGSIAIVSAYHRELERTMRPYRLELLELIPDQPARGALQQEFVSDFIKFATRAPKDNRSKIENGIFEMQLAKRPGQQDSDMKMENDAFHVKHTLQKIGARILPRVNVAYNGYIPQITEASWNLEKAHEYYESTEFKSIEQLFVWRILSGNSSPAEDRLYMTSENNLRDELQKRGANGSRLNIERRKFVHAPGRDAEFERDFDQACQELIKHHSRDAFVVVVLPSTSKIRYRIVKSLAEIKHGIRTQCMVFSNFTKSSRAPLSNLVSKINIKMGGTAHTPFFGPALSELKKLGIPSLEKTVIMGVDVVHPSTARKMRGCPSMAAVVGSTDGNYGQYRASVRAQPSGQEKIQNSQQMFFERFSAWSQMNKGKVPEMVMVYRDGVSESQVEEIRKTEIPAVFEAWERVKEFSEHKKLQLNFIVVTKRHLVRFHATQGTPTDRKGNITAGLVVDEQIVHHFEFDFYLQAHQAIQGTARPAHYHVLRNDLSLTADATIRMTHMLCFALGRATKGISYAAPTYLADICCDRAAGWMNYDCDLERRRSETREEYANRCLDQFLQENPEWNRDDRVGPWHSSLDDSMFWT